MWRRPRVTSAACVKFSVTHELLRHIAISPIAVIDAEVSKPSRVVVPAWSGDAYTTETVGILSNAESVGDGIGVLLFQPATSEYVALHVLPFVQVVGQRFVYRENASAHFRFRGPQGLVAGVLADNSELHDIGVVIEPAESQCLAFPQPKVENEHGADSHGPHWLGEQTFGESR